MRKGEIENSRNREIEKSRKGKRTTEKEKWRSLLFLLIILIFVKIPKIVEHNLRSILIINMLLIRYLSKY